jgi:hypothetical protein
MGITISGPSTQIPTNVVEVGNEITQNQLNAITASQTPSVGNPMQTQSAMVQYLNGNVWPSITNKTTQPQYNWNHPFPYSGNFVTVLKAETGQWWPWSSNGTLLGSVYNGPYDNSYDFSFYDDNSNYISLSGTATVGDSNTNYTALGYWDANTQSTYTSSSGNSYFGATGPTYAGNWDNPIASASFYSMNNGGWMYRYVYLDGSGGFYTADNMNNPPY